MTSKSPSISPANDPCKVTLCLLGNLHAVLLSDEAFENQPFENFFQEYHQSAQFWFQIRPNIFVRPDLDPDSLFVKIISRRHSSAYAKVLLIC